MTAEEFVAQLEGENQRRLSLLAPDDTLKPEVEGDLNVLNLLKVALKNEIEATEIAARWLVTTDEVDVKLALATLTVLPTMRKLEYIVELKRVIRRKFTLGTGDGWLKADGDTIYTAKDLRVGLFQAGESAPAGA